MSYLLTKFNFIYNNIYGYVIIILGNIAIYYNKLYNYMNIDNKYIITKIIKNNEIIDYIPKNNKGSVEIYYNYNNRQYINIYKNNIQFPPYKDLTLKPFNITDESIILITMNPSNNIDSIQILHLIKQLSGPKGDFYKDTDNQISKNDMILYLNKTLNCSILVNTYIEIMYSDGNSILL